MKPYPIVRDGQGRRVPLSWKEKLLFRAFDLVGALYLPVRSRLPIYSVCRHVQRPLNEVLEWIRSGDLKTWTFRGQVYSRSDWVDAAVRKRIPFIGEL